MTWDPSRKDMKKERTERFSWPAAGLGAGLAMALFAQPAAATFGDYFLLAIAVLSVVCGAIFGHGMRGM